jgi:hypothetical protein
VGPDREAVCGEETEVEGHGQEEAGYRASVMGFVFVRVPPGET